VADCYSIEHFKKTYAHCLEPVEGMQHWPASDNPKPIAPGYVKLPGRPKKERRKERHEKPKATKLSKVGTVSKCSWCKCTTHNKRTCAEYKAHLAVQGGGGQANPSLHAHANSTPLITPVNPTQRAPSRKNNMVS